MSQIEQLKGERDNIKSEYNKNIETSDALYHEKIKLLDNESTNIFAKVEALKANVILKDDKRLSLIQSDLAASEKKYSNIIEKQGTSFQAEINSLTNEYTNSYNHNQKYYSNFNLIQTYGDILTEIMLKS